MAPDSALRRFARAGLGRLLALVVTLWVATLRVRVLRSRALDGDAAARRPWVLAFFHGTQLALHGLRRRGTTCVLVSRSRDGDVQASALGALGFSVVRGSSSLTASAAARSLATLVRAVRRGADAAFAVDGPRGPYGVPKPGAHALASRADALLVPAGCAPSRSWVLGRTWDRFVLPVPFSRVVIVLGDPVVTAEALGPSIAECNQRARAALGGAQAALPA